MDKDFVTGKKVKETLGVHQQTLYLWDRKGKIETIRTPGGKRLYNLKKFLAERDKPPLEIKEIPEQDEIKEDRIKIIYARVSSRNQIDDLERQKKYLTKRYPHHYLIDDVGSGINMNRRGLRKIIKLAIAGKVEELVIAHKDRLARFGFELIEDLIKDYSNGKVIIINNVVKKEPEAELVWDMLQIMNIFVAKMNGLRKYKDDDNSQLIEENEN